MKAEVSFFGFFFNARKRGHYSYTGSRLAAKKPAAKEEKPTEEKEKAPAAPKEPESFEFSASMPAMSAQDL